MRSAALRLGLALAGVGVAAACVALTSEKGGARPPAPPAVSTASPGVVEDKVRIRYAAGSAPVLSLPGGERKPIQSLLKISHPMQFGSYVWDDRGVAQGPVWVRVDVSKQLISVFRGADEIGSAVILYGANSKPTPAGAFTVLQKAKDYHSRTYDAPMPFMLRLTDDGVAIHASNVREGWATHGCIGVPQEFASRLFAAMKVGDAVFIIA